MQQKDDLSTFLYKLNLLYSNMTEFLSKFSESLTSSKDYIDVTSYDTDGTTSSTTIPSVGAMKGDINALNSQMESLIYNNDDTISLKFTDGTVRSFEMKKISELVNDLEAIENETFDTPVSFRVKNNWFFESFLNPLLFVTVNVAEYTEGNNIDRFSVKKLILNVESSSDIQYFDDNIKGRSDLDYDTVITDLRNQGIDFAVDDNIVELPAAINRNRGTFLVNKIYEDTVDESDGGSVDRRRYELDQLTYKRVVNSSETVVYLDIDDRMLTDDDTEYKVLSVDRENNIITLELVHGSQPINIGTTLKVKPEAYRVPDLNINMGFNERTIIFTRPISRTLDMTTDKLSNGFAVYSNELTIELSDGVVLTLDTYYQNFVSDFGSIFLNMAKERTVPAVSGITPDAPSLDPNSFKVSWVNRHIFEDEALTQLKEKIATKEKLNSEISELNKSINELQSKLNSIGNTNIIERNRLQKEINDKSTQKSGLVSQLSTIISEITLGIKSDPQFTSTPEYKVRGFFDIPDPKEIPTGTQDAVQFIISYRPISKKGTAANVDQFTRTDENGTERIDSFSPWTEVYSKVRDKVLDTDNGDYVWNTEDTQNADVVNINQVDIPIKATEAIQVRVKTVSEAGFPVNPLTSDWSNIVTIPFPDEFETTEDALALANSLLQEETRVKFQEELNSQGLDIHLLNAITSGDKYYGHKSEDVASGFFTSEGNIISLFEALQDAKNRIQALEAAIEQERGVIKVSLTQPNGYVQNIKKGDVIEAFAGFYLDDIRSETENQNISYNHGEIIEKTYILSIQNTSKTPLELAARIAGGVDERVPLYTSSSVDDDYKNNRKYDLAPISVTTLGDGDIGGFKHKAPFQSNHAKSMFIYSRYKDFGLSDDLYYDVGYENLSYDYEGQAVDKNNDPISETIPYNEGHLLPYYPGYDTGNPTDADIWDGDTTGTEAVGNGYLSEFAVHKDHPDIQTEDVTGSVNDFDALVFPSISGETTQKYPLLSHGLYFDVEDGRSSALGATNLQQVLYRQVTDDTDKPSNYPIKLGFAANDEYLVGRFTCGSYLFMGPSTYADVSIEGNHPRISKRSVPFGDENALNIPLIFQYRCSDKLEYVGGYRSSETLSNVRYTKKIGIDIYEKLNSSETDPSYGDLFSFDIRVSCLYKKDAATDAPVSIPGTGTTNEVITYVEA